MAAHADQTPNKSFLVLLILIVGMLVVNPIIDRFFAISVIIDVFLTAIFLANVFVLSRNRRMLIVGALTVAPLLVCTWYLHFSVNRPVIIIGRLFAIIFFSITIIEISRFILNAREVTRGVIYAAVVIYLLLAILWSFIYSLLELILPASFVSLRGVPIEALQNTLTYYSFVTITTLGYGDITPSTEIARGFTIIEAVIGQLYLVVIVAWLVGMHVSRKSRV